jgi:hypothetical protein
MPTTGYTHGVLLPKDAPPQKRALAKHRELVKSSLSLSLSLSLSVRVIPNDARSRQPYVRRGLAIKIPAVTEGLAR